MKICLRPKNHHQCGTNRSNQTDNYRASRTQESFGAESGGSPTSGPPQNHALRSEPPHHYPHKWGWREVESDKGGRGGRGRSNKVASPLIVFRTWYIRYQVRQGRPSGGCLVGLTTGTRSPMVRVVSGKSRPAQRTYRLSSSVGNWLAFLWNFEGSQFFLAIFWGGKEGKKMIHAHVC